MRPRHWMESSHPWTLFRQDHAVLTREAIKGSTWTAARPTLMRISAKRGPCTSRREIQLSRGHSEVGCGKDLTTNTGQWAILTTFSVTLPISIDRRPVQPWVPITIKSICSSFA